MKISMTIGFAILAAALGALAACSSSTAGNGGSSGSSGYTDHTSPYPDCDRIIKACHPFDIGEGTIHDCHDQGHEATSNALCTPVLQMCLDTCHAAAVDAGVPIPDGGV